MVSKISSGLRRLSGSLSLKGKLELIRTTNDSKLLHNYSTHPRPEIRLAVANNRLTPVDILINFYKTFIPKEAKFKIPEAAFNNLKSRHPDLLKELEIEDKAFSGSYSAVSDWVRDRLK